MTMDLVFNWGDPVIGVAPHLPVVQHPQADRLDQHPAYSNPKVDELLDTGGGMLDPVKRKAYYADLPEDRHRRACRSTSSTSVPYHTAASKKVGNVPTTRSGAPMSPLDEVYLK